MKRGYPDPEPGRGAEKRARRCYSCYPRESNRFNHYFWIDDLALNEIWVNVNLARICEICIVPREHVVEFRAMAPDVASTFWKQTGEVVKRLVDDYGAKDVALEVSYGNWITHFHAHVHILASNMTDVLTALKSKRQVLCDINNLQVKKIYPGDPTVKLPFTPKIHSNNWNKFPLFRLCQDWFGALPGFVVRVEMTPVPREAPEEAKEQAMVTDTFTCSYWIRTDKKEQELFERLKKSPPKGLQI